MVTKNCFNFRFIHSMSGFDGQKIIIIIGYKKLCLLWLICKVRRTGRKKWLIVSLTYKKKSLMVTKNCFHFRFADKVGGSDGGM